MCEYSLESKVSREAEQGDRMYIKRVNDSSHQGFHVDKIVDGALTACLTCVKQGGKFQLRDVKFARFGCGWNNGKTPDDALYANKDFVVTMIQGWGNLAHKHDAIEFPDGSQYPMNAFAVGQQAVMGEPRDLNKLFEIENARELELV